MKPILGIDVGGTKIASGLVAENLEVSDLRVGATSQSNLINQIIELVGSYKDFSAIGLTMPGPVLADGTVKRLPNIANFQPTNFTLLLAEKFRVPVKVVNDAKALAYLEANKGQGTKKNIVAGVVLGTGTGVGVVVDKQILAGKDGLVGEFDHIVLPDGRMFRELVKIARPFNHAEEAKNYLKTLISIVILSYNPDLIVLSGGWSQLPGMTEVLKQVSQNVGGYENETEIVISKYEYPSLLGAALYALKK